MCGLAGIITKEPRVFDYATFCTLGIANDSRGGDSCGIFIDGRYEYGTNGNRLFSRYFQNSTILDETTKSMIALVHCRKASVGKINEETAQPVVLTDDNGKVLYVLMHNGTIHNYKELAKKYIPEINIEGMTDSQVMARIFFNCGYKALEEYNGGAVFVMVDYRGKSPKTLLFKGASKKNKFSKEEEDERPLYYCIDENRRELVFSSIYTYLIALRSYCDVYSMKANTLVEFNGKSLVLLEEHSRDNCIQDKEIPLVPTYSWKSFYDEDDVIDYGFASFSSYIGIDYLTNTCSYHGNKMHGKFYVSVYGKVSPFTNKNFYEVFFYNGVALKNSHCFRFLSILKKDSGLSDKEFMDKFQSIVRFLSIDGVYLSGGIWYKATSPQSSIVFTGKYRPFSSATEITIDKGLKRATSYTGLPYPINEALSSNKDINFKELKKLCMSLTKQQEN